MKKRKIAILIDRERNLLKCIVGLRQLNEALTKGYIIDLGCYTVSSVGNKDALHELLREISNAEADVIIVCDEGPDHLAISIDNYLRYELKNSKTVVIPVVFTSKNNSRKAIVAQFCIEQSKGAQIHTEGELYDEMGFHKAILMATEFELTLVASKEVDEIMIRNFSNALKDAEKMKKRR